MTSAIGWYGPLIDLSKAAFHIGDFVQLLVFVHRSTPIQFKLSKGREAIRTDIHVGDDTRPFFSVSIWHKQMGSIAVSGDVVMLQNVKITKFGHVIEARTESCSSVLSLVHPFESLVSKGVDDLLVECQVGTAAREKLGKVVKWVKQGGSTLCTFRVNSIAIGGSYTNYEGQQKRHLSKNWKAPDISKPQDCFWLSEVSRLSYPCKAVFTASIGEIFLPIISEADCLDDSEKENMFISRRLSKSKVVNMKNSLVEDLICTGCQLCGTPLGPEKRLNVEQSSVPLYCTKSSNHFHVASLIYRPFLLYVWDDESEYLPILVKNTAAELLFGNIKAEKVYMCSVNQKHNIKSHGTQDADKAKTSADFCSLVAQDKAELASGLNWYLIWLVVLKVLLQQRNNNGRYKFEITVNPKLEEHCGKFEMVSFSFPPCIESKFGGS